MSYKRWVQRGDDIHEKNHLPRTPQKFCKTTSQVMMPDKRPRDGIKLVQPGVRRQVRKGLPSALGWAPALRGLPDWVSGDSSPEVQELKSSCEAGGQNPGRVLRGRLSRGCLSFVASSVHALHAGGKLFTHDFLLSRGGAKKISKFLLGHFGKGQFF